MKAAIAGGFVAALLAACAAAPAVAPGAATPVCGPQQYPFHALQEFESGRVVVAAEVRPDGALATPRVEASSGHPFLDAAALDAVRWCRFPPTGGGSARVRLLVAYDLLGQEEYLPRGAVSIGVLPPVPAGR